MEAEAPLNDGLQEDPNNTDILVNLLVNSQFMGKPQEVNFTFYMIMSKLYSNQVHFFGRNSYSPRLCLWSVKINNKYLFSI